MKKQRILSGMRPTGKLHLGHLVGALESWVQLQGEYENFHLIADWHALTTGYEDTSELKSNTHEMVIDWLAAGIDPDQSPIFVQSHIPEHAELHLVFSMLITVARLERNPAVKEQAKALNLEDKISYGHLGYPVLQAADILLYKANLVPVGEDQVPHVEISRELARRFNKLYKTVFPEPEAKLTEFKRLPGMDGQRMSKSLGNSILMANPPEIINKKLRRTITDPQKIHKGDPGRPDICPINTYNAKFDPPTLQPTREGCMSGALGCVEHKVAVAAKIIEYLEPIWAKRRHYEANPEAVRQVIAEGDRRAGEVARRTMEQVREAMKLP